MHLRRSIRLKVGGLVACLVSSGDAAVRSADPEDLRLLELFEDGLRLMPESGPYAPEILNLPAKEEQRLRRCCRAFLGVGAQQYLRLRRLKRVRTALLKAGPRKARVSDIARTYGFHNIDQFTAAYRLAFGEAPSSTLAHL